jgi:hypothetical protein
MAAAVCVATVLASGCAAVFGGGQRFAALQSSCGAATDYGADAQAVYSTLFDAYVAYRHGRLSQAQYCAFAKDIATHYDRRTNGGPGKTAATEPDAPRAWAEYFNAQRVKAIDWRAQVDPTLRGG